MLQLKIAAQPEWLEPAHGVRVKMLPPSTPVIVEARRISAGLMVAHGVEMDDDGVGHMGQALFVMTAAYVAAGALEWEGVADDTGSPAQTLTPDQVVALLGQEPEIFDFFDRGYASEVHALMSEKKDRLPCRVAVRGGRRILLPGQLPTTVLRGRRRALPLRPARAENPARPPRLGRPRRLRRPVEVERVRRLRPGLRRRGRLRAAGRADGRCDAVADVRGAASGRGADHQGPASGG